MKLPRVYPITDTRIAGMSHASQVERLIGGGAALIQLREKHASLGELFDDAAAAIAVARRYGVKVIVNDRVDLALALKADGVHLGQDDLPPGEARRLLGPHSVIGISTHTLAQVEEAAKAPVDYIAFGPVYPTETKQNPDPLVGLGLISQIREIAPTLPLVAIGGIDHRNAAAVIAAGADSIAVVSALLRGDITQNTVRMLNIVDN